MKISRQVLYAVDDACSGRPDAALLHACCAVDATAKRLYPKSTGVRVRYVNCLRRYYWLLEPMMVGGINLEETRFTNIRLKNSGAPDFAEVIYEILRCSHAHGDEVPSAFSLLPTVGGFNSEWKFGNNELHMPDRVIWALLSVAVLSKVNKHETTTGTYYLSLGDERFPVNEWWGREDDFRPIAARYNQVRVKIDGLQRLEERREGDPDKIERVKIINPPASRS